ncbi:MAG: hypothetical protein HQ592_15385 [Planctomycetes bacterium]|nr:hypothetical protein [Planctomycetota bacterium]
MNKLFVLIFAVALVAMDGCSKKQEGAGETGGVKKTGSKEKVETAPEAEAKLEPKLLAGELGSSSRWCSGWLDLATTTDFAKSDLLRLRIGGTATKILVRLLPKGISADRPHGIIGGAITVADNRIVEVVFDTDRKGIVQISIHGGPNPWGRYPLGASNGCLVTIESAELIPHKK